MKILEINKLFKSYKNVEAVKGISLEVEEKTIYGFIGPNGAGKSTTIRAIMNLINIDSGEIIISGKKLKRNEKELLETIGYLPSEVNLYPELTVDKTLKYFASFYKENKNVAEKTNYLTKKLSLDLDKKIEELSLGNLKKVGLVLALMHNPKIIILDEPTSGLDPLMQNIFFELIKEEKERGATIILSTHILSEVKKTCDYVSIIKDGNIIKTDTVENLLSREYVNVSIESNEIDKLKLVFKECKITKSDNHNLSFIYENSFNDLIKALVNFNIKKLTINEPSIEDIFMHYYS